MEMKLKKTDKKMKIIRGSRARPLIESLNSFLDGDDSSLKELLRITKVSEEKLRKF